MEPLVLDLSAPHQKYIGKDGTQYPGVTTVLGELAKPALYRWYASEERDGILKAMASGAWSAERLKAALPRAKSGGALYFAEMRRDRAADLGTVVHERIRAWHLGTTLSPQGIPPEVYEQSEHGFERFKSWWEGEGMKLKCAEFQMVSEALDCGGTGDQFGYAPDGVLEYWDTKTGKPWRNGRPYPEQIAQSAAYAAMFHEATGEYVGRIRIARIGKEKGDDGQLYAVSASERVRGEDLFQAARYAYRARKALSA